MTRDEVEAEIWRTLSHYTQVPRVHHVAGLLNAVDAHVATALGEIDNYRRNREPVVHYRAGVRIAVCRCWTMIDPVLTTSRAHVTCGACKRTRAYREAA